MASRKISSADKNTDSINIIPLLFPFQKKFYKSRQPFSWEFWDGCSVWKWQSILRNATCRNVKYSPLYGKSGVSELNSWLYLYKLQSNHYQPITNIDFTLLFNSDYFHFFLSPRTEITLSLALKCYSSHIRDIVLFQSSATSVKKTINI